jgi:hypothetical protein
MEVKLVSYSQPTEEFANEGVDNVQDLIAFVLVCQIHLISLTPKQVKN